MKEQKKTIEELLKKEGIEFKEVTIFENSEDIKRDKTIKKYVMEIEEAYKKAKNSKLTFKGYSTNTYSPFPAPTN